MILRFSFGISLLILVLSLEARADLTMCSLNCAGQAEPVRTLCMMNCMDSQIDAKIEKADQTVDKRWQSILADTDQRVDGVKVDVSQILTDADTLVDENLADADQMIENHINNIDFIAQDKLDQIKNLLSEEKALGLGIALASGMALGDFLTSTALGIVEEGVGAIVSAISEYITGDKKKEELRQNFLAASENFEELEGQRDSSLETIEDSLTFFDLYNGLSEVNGETPSPSRQNFEIRRSRLRQRHAQLDLVKQDNIGNDCWVKADLEQSQIMNLISQIDEAIVLIPDGQSNGDPRERVCENLLESISRQIGIENELQVARTGLIQGHFAMREHRMEELERRAELFKDVTQFSGDALDAATSALSASQTPGYDISNAIQTMVESSSDIHQIVTLNHNDLNVSVSDAVIGFMFDDNKVTDLIVDQICFNSPLRCRSLDVDDKRLRAYKSLRSLAHRCQVVNDPAKTCERNSLGITVNCDISDKINNLLVKVEKAMPLDLMTEYADIPAGISLNPNQGTMQNLVQSVHDL